MNASEIVPIHMSKANIINKVGQPYSSVDDT